MTCIHYKEIVMDREEIEKEHASLLNKNSTSSTLVNGIFYISAFFNLLPILEPIR